MTLYFLTFRLQSDSLFGRGDGVAGLVDEEVQHDTYGCPYFGGRTIKGILVNECADILAALPTHDRSLWEAAALSLFGRPGSSHTDTALLHVGPAQIPHRLRFAIQQDMDSQRPSLTREMVLSSLTALRRGTAIDPESGVAKNETLRTMRMILRETPFEAELHLGESDNIKQKHQQMLLAACLKAFRSVGTGRNRGHGRLKDVDLLDADRKSVLNDLFQQFCQEA